MRTRESLELIEQQTLKPYACFSNSAERRISIPGHIYRTNFQRDRDRILHSKALRRLEYKTQVFLTQTGDHLRTRLTHSYEVSQLARTVANQVGLNCDLVETIALGHDLGHTPFGHAGEEALKELLEEFGAGTFKHNLQSIRIIDKLERKYSYDGLNLTLPVREGILKHTKLPEIIPEYCEDLFAQNKVFQLYQPDLHGQTWQFFWRLLSLL
jgi:dGTPase